jgi:hypothetical protein
MPKLSIEDVLNRISDGDTDIIDYMGGIENVLKIAVKKGALEDIQWWNTEWTDYENVILLALLNSDDPEIRKQTYENVKVHLINSDLDKINDEWYIVLDSLSDLNELFVRADQHTVEEVFSEDYWEPFGWNSSDDIYHDVIEELTPENLTLFKERFSSEIIGQVVDPTYTNLLEEMCEESESCDGESLTITQEMIDRIMGDEKSTKYLLKKYLDNISSDLYNIHSDAYNSAYVDDCYDEIWSELSPYFVQGSNIWKDYSSPNSSKRNSKVLLKVTDEIDTVIYDWVSTNKKETYNDYFMSYHGKYLEILRITLDDGNGKLRVSFPDYPDYRKVDNLINQNFINYF